MKNIIDLLKGKCKENREIILKLEKVYKLYGKRAIYYPN